MHWTRLGEGVLPNTWVTSITVDPTDADHVYASFSSYKEGDRAANVWETTDGGTTWRNISSDLPNAPDLARALRRAPPTCSTSPTTWACS